MILHHHTKFGYKRWSSSSDVVLIYIYIYAFIGSLNMFCHRTLTLITLKSNQIFSDQQKTIQLMMVSHQTSFICKMMSGSNNIVEPHIDYTDPHCELDHEDCKPNFLYDIPAHDDASYQAWLQKGQLFRPNCLHGQTN